MKLPFYLIEDYKNYITDLNKDIALLILLESYTRTDAVSFIRAFDEFPTINDYKILTKKIYPWLYNKMTKVLESGPIDYYLEAITDNNLWEQIFLSLISERSSGQLPKSVRDNLGSDEENSLIIKDTDSFVLKKGILYYIIKKILIMIEYPYLYSQIKDIYTLKQIGDIEYLFGIDLDKKLVNYFKTGNTSDINLDRYYLRGLNLILMFLLLKDGLKLTAQDLLYLIEDARTQIGYTIKYNKDEYEYPFKSLIDFLTRSNVDKSKLQEILDQGLINPGEEYEFYRDIVNYIKS